MYLAKLEIIGFKSFLQKVNLAFDSGISAIVGPNGCGKTNIVDAIRWVLGEQRYSALRSEKMEDVIFNGTKSRKPLGMAEVSLVIENTRGILPSDYTEVTVSRRVYRSGESEYLLNKIPCRLKDILDLFMDTGMGADAYSVIELKMVETILSDKTDERRRLFEEAAGVTKYKHRRKAAYRKLESVQADLTRVNDIVSEVHKAVSGLERQARKAEQFNTVKVRLKALEIELMEREFAQLVGRTVPLGERLATLTEDKSRMDADLEREEAAHEALREALTTVERRLGDAQRDVGLHMEKMHRVEEKNLVAAERIRSLHANIARLEQDIAELQVGRELEEQRKAELEMQSAELRTREDQSRSELESRQRELREFEAVFDGRKAELQTLNDRTIALVHEIAERQTEIDRWKGRLENLNGRIQRSQEEIMAYESEIGRLTADIEALTAEDKDLRRSFTGAEMRFYDAEARKNELKEQAERLRRQVIEKVGEIQQLEARTEFLRGLIDSRGGLSEGARHLAASGRWKPSRNVTVADAINAEGRFRTAIEAALGEYAGFIVVDSADDVEQGIRLLQEDQKGKATFVCLDRLPEIRAVRRLPPIPGVLGWAADLAQFDGLYRPLFHYVLDRVLIVEDRNVALEAASAVSGVRCVTLEGEIVTGVGVTRGGGAGDEEGGVIGKQEQIEALNRSIGSLGEAVNALKHEGEEIQRQHDAIELRSLTDAVKGIEKEMNGVEMRIAQLAFEKKRAEEVIAKNNEEVITLSSELSELQAGIERESPGLEELKSRKSDVERSIGALTQEIQTLDAEWNERSQVVQSLGIALVRVRGELQNATDALRRTEEAIAALRDSVQKDTEAIHSGREEIAATEAAVGDNAGILQEFVNERDRLEAARTGVQEEAKRSREEMHQIEMRVKDKRREADECLRSLHDHELRVHDLNAKAEHIKARALEEFEHHLELRTYPDNEFVDFAALRDDIQTLRERSKSLGNINFAAFEEYNTEKQRLQFLTTQRNDLIEAEKTLLATIEEINATAQKKFLDTFELIRRNFIETFKSLFDPGDECDLRLEENVDPLEAGIEIIAKPRGKRPTSIDLLSGGEKTLTATALLFAIYLVKPSPFCILDEVDAPLDDANIDRFTRILRKFSDKTQFIVVTHNKRTMEAANALYGVTMEEEGVSKIVTVRFNRAAQVTSAAVAS
jgi:chromosome segregation protein